VAAERGWQREFDEPIETPDGTRLNTLREAVACLAKTVPKSEHDMSAVTTAAEMLTYALSAVLHGCLWRASACCRRCIGTMSGNSIPTPKSIIGESES
jgi:hypothetical protein